MWAASRKNNFEIYALEQKALDAERRLKEVASQVEEVGSWRPHKYYALIPSR